jgi:hypothetical protein
MIIGTPNFPSFADAVDYYSQQGIELRDVRRKIRSKEIYIGKPKLEDGEELLVVEEFPSERPGFGLRYYKKISE